MIRTTTIALALAVSLVAPALAQQPAHTPPPYITVVSTATMNGLAYATIRDNGMRGHNVFNVTVGAHIGSYVVTRITATGIELADDTQTLTVAAITR